MMLEKGKWIKSGKTAECPLFRKKFAIEKEVKKATLQITAAGVYEAMLNGTRVGDFFLAPGWTTYRFRHQVQEYDVTALLQAENKLEVLVGSGWFNGAIAWACKSEHPVMLLAELQIEYTDGTTETIYTDGSWQTAESAVREADIYHGEVFDATFCDNAPVAAAECDYPKTQLIPQEGEKICLQEQLKPVRRFTTPKGETVLDFGQEISGIVRIETDAPRGTCITLRCAEMLDRDGNFYIDNYRDARSTMQLICAGGKTVWQPQLTFYGFRYICVEGWPGEVQPQAFTAIMACSDLKRTGTLTSGVQKLNRLFENIHWGQRDNFVDVPTDCPQRDERLGWTGDAQVFINAACYQYDTKRFYTKWLNDVKVDQRKDGSVPRVVPAVLDRPTEDGVCSSTAWGDAATICPWQLYRHYGDKALLASHFDMMKRWVDYMTAQTDTPYLWTGYEQKKDRYHFGDWLGLDAADGSYTGSSDKDFIASAYYAYSTELVCKAGCALGADVTAYETLYRNIVATFREKYSECHTQTECALAVYFNLAVHKQAVADQLAQMVQQNGNRLTTGFVGTPYLLYALSQNGHADVAYALLLQEDFPSWLYAVNHGATTIWEHWDGRRADGTFWSEKMNSFNHYAYGAVAGWVFEEAAGITPLETAPGFAQVRVAPKPDARLGWLRAELDTPHGKIVSAWFAEDDRVRYEITVPVAAEIEINGVTQQVTAGTYLF